jgi:hypothetical protein
MIGSMAADLTGERDVASIVVSVYGIERIETSETRGVRACLVLGR